MTRRYRKRKRAEQEHETRQRIVEATVQLHQELGPAQTTIRAIAERAGVQRVTVYRHFPDERAILGACSNHFMSENPFPDWTPWFEIDDPIERLRTALRAIYTFHEQTAPMMDKIFRDMPVKLELAEVSQPMIELFGRLVTMLAQPLGSSTTVHAAVAHALDFQTWRSLVRANGLSKEEAIELMIRMVEGAQELSSD
jgi:AcrR family transcriptional regulator